MKKARIFFTGGGYLISSFQECVLDIIRGAIAGDSKLAPVSITTVDGSAFNAGEVMAVSIVTPEEEAAAEKEKQQETMMDKAMLDFYTDVNLIRRALERIASRN